MDARPKHSSGKRKGKKRGRDEHVQATLRRVNDPAAEARDKGLEALHPNEEFIVPAGLSNTLPDVPVGPFYLKEGLGESFWRYNMMVKSSMEDGHDYKILPEVGAGVYFDLMNARGGLAVEVVKSVQLSSVEEDFTNESLHRPASAANRPTARGSLEGVEFARRFGRLDADSHKRQNTSSAKAKSADRERFDKHMAAYKATLGAQTPLQRAEASFKAVSADATLRHPTKPDVTPVQSWSVLPDETMWASQIVHVVFEDSPYARRSAVRAKAQRTLDPKDLTGETQQDAADEHGAQLARSVIRTPADALSSAAGLVGELLAPSAADATAADAEARPRQTQLETAAEEAQRSAPADTPAQVSTGGAQDEVHCRFVRQYNLSLQAYPHPHGSTEEDEAAAEAIAAGQPPKPADTQVVLVWDHEGGTVRMLPLAARVQAAELHSKTPPSDALLRRRTLTAAEQQEEDDAIAGVMTDSLAEYRHTRAKAALEAATARHEQHMEAAKKRMKELQERKSAAAATFSAPADDAGDLFAAEDED